MELESRTGRPPPPPFSSRKVGRRGHCRSRAASAEPVEDPTPNPRQRLGVTSGGTQSSRLRAGPSWSPRPKSVSHGWARPRQRTSPRANPLVPPWRILGGTKRGEGRGHQQEGVQGGRGGVSGCHETKGRGPRRRLPTDVPDRIGPHRTSFLHLRRRNSPPTYTDRFRISPRLRESVTFRRVVLQSACL